MQCPHCNAICMADDPICYNCRREFPSGIPRAKVITVTGLLCAMLVFSACIVLIPFTKTGDGAAVYLMTLMILTVGAGFGGMALGWVLGGLISNH